MAIFKNKQEENIMDDFIIKDGEREILGTYGKYHLFAPDETFDAILLSAIQEGVKREVKGKLVLSDLDFIIDVFKALTDLPNEILEKDNFKKMQKRPTYNMRKMLLEINKIFQENLNAQMGIISGFKDMPPEMQAQAIKNAQKLVENKEEISEYEQYLELKQRYESNNDETEEGDDSANI